MMAEEKEKANKVILRLQKILNLTIKMLISIFTSVVLWKIINTRGMFPQAEIRTIETTDYIISGLLLWAGCAARYPVVFFHIF